MKRLLWILIVSSVLLAFTGHTASAHTLEVPTFVGPAERALEALGAEHGQFLLTWATSSPDRVRVVLSALSEAGGHWVYGSMDPDVGLDCSGLTRYAWSQVDVTLPASSRQQLRKLPPATGDARPGDLWGWPGHVMMSLGVDDYVVHSTGRKNGIVVASVTRPATQVRPAIHDPDPERTSRA